MAWGEWLSLVMVERAEAYSEALVGEGLAPAALQESREGDERDMGIIDGVWRSASVAKDTPACVGA